LKKEENGDRLKGWRLHSSTLLIFEDEAPIKGEIATPFGLAMIAVINVSFV
jgi:hypothetical protein